MRVFEATITSRGQVTIPAEVRRKLGLTRRARVTFLIEDDAVRLVPARLTLESVVGSVEPLPHQWVDFGQEIEEAMVDHADEGRVHDRRSSPQRVGRSPGRRASHEHRAGGNLTPTGLKRSLFSDAATACS